MGRIALTSGAYQSESLIANAQRCVNLYPEANPPETDPPSPATHYLTPGLTVLATPPAAGAGRGLYVATNGQLYAVVGSTVYAVSPGWDFKVLGTIASSINPVSMADNETVAFLVDGTAFGYTINIDTNTFAKVTDPNYQGADRVDFLDTFFLFNKPLTPQFYTSLSNTATFDNFALYFANMVGIATDLQVSAALHGQIWLIGERGTEIWITNGDTSGLFPFQRVPEAVIHQGCIAKYSVCRHSGIDDTQTCLMWLGQNDEGTPVVLKAMGYAVSRVSTFAIENEFRGYAQISDAVGWTYEQNGHAFYVLSFPGADKTWCFDLSSGQWHERIWLDGDGQPHRHRGNCAAFAYGVNVCLDWQTGQLYKLDIGAYTDAGQPIQRLRSFPHLVNDFKRVQYAMFQADMEVGEAIFANDGFTADNPPLVSLRWSDDRGRTFGNSLSESLGAEGEYQTSPTWYRLGQARDRVFELSWSAAVKTALNGAFVDPIPLAS